MPNCFALLNLNSPAFIFGLLISRWKYIIECACMTVRYLICSKKELSKLLYLLISHSQNKYFSSYTYFKS